MVWHQENESSIIVHKAEVKNLKEAQLQCWRKQPWTMNSNFPKPSIFNFSLTNYKQSGLEIREYDCRDVTLTMWHPLSAKVGTNFAYKQWSLGRYSSLVD
jgi:hypothetical protein